MSPSNSVGNLSLTYMKIGDRTLETQESYKTGKISEDSRRIFVQGGDGTPIIGMAGKKNDQGRIYVTPIFLWQTDTSRPVEIKRP